jgi:hypothetical protein
MQALAGPSGGRRTRRGREESTHQRRGGVRPVAHTRHLWAAHMHGRPTCRSHVPQWRSAGCPRRLTRRGSNGRPPRVDAVRRATSRVRDVSPPRRSRRQGCPPTRVNRRDTGPACRCPAPEEPKDPRRSLQVGMLPRRSPSQPFARRRRVFPRLQGRFPRTPRTVSLGLRRAPTALKTESWEREDGMQGGTVVAPLRVTPPA